MTATDAAGPNADQVGFWNNSAGPAWVAAQRVLDAQLRDLGLAAMQALAASEGETLIDIGCGCGDTTLELARRVGPSGAVLGVDVSRPMLEVARRRAAERDLTNASFLQADAQTSAFPPADGAFSRFGVMFFEDPPAAFANIRRALRPGGRLAFVCWRAMSENAWMTVPMAAAASLLPPPAHVDPGAPGPFALADAERVRGILGAAGFTDVGIEAHDQKIGWPDVDSALEVALNAGPLGRALRENPSVAHAAAEKLREAFTALVGPEGLRLDSATWIVRAR
jgi:SAM-dependent methyltransferase